MKEGFRQTMAWLHTWTGLVVGWVLYFVFVTGTIGYFYVEIDRWMRPELPLADKSTSVREALALADSELRRVAPNADTWFLDSPVGRHLSDIGYGWTTTSEGQLSQHRRIFDPETREFRKSDARQTGGGYLLYRMHWQLHYLPRNLGEWVVGISSMCMLLALITGVITHKKIFVDFFTFRPGANQTSWLDGHTVLSVLALPFFVMITYTGLVFFTSAFTPAAVQMVYGSVKAYGDDYIAPAAKPPAQRAAPVLPLEHFSVAATRYWGKDAAWWRLQVTNPGDANAEVRIWHAGNGIILRDVGEQLHFSAVDGQLIRQVTARRAMAKQTESTLTGLHEAIFAGPVLRWLYFMSGLLGCGMIATGLVLWTVKRRSKSLRNGDWGFGHRLVERLNIGTIAGLLVAIAAYFWANRLLPAALPGRERWEVHCMAITWAAMLIYAAVRSPMRAWVEELWIAAGAFALLPIVNALTTHRHLGVTIPAGNWTLAAFDLTVFAFGIVMAAAAIKVHGRLRQASAVRHTPALAVSALQEVQ